MSGFGSHGENYARHSSVPATAASTVVAHLVGGVAKAYKSNWFSQVKTWYVPWTDGQWRRLWRRFLLEDIVLLDPPHPPPMVSFVRLPVGYLCCMSYYLAGVVTLGRWG